MLTFLPLEQINEMDKWEGSKLNEAKEILAYELTKLVHGEDDANQAKEAARSLFGAGNGDSAPTVELTSEDLTDGTLELLTALVKAEMTASRSEARRAVEQGGVTVDGEKITDIKAVLTEEQLKAGVLLKKGKKSFKKLVLV